MDPIFLKRVALRNYKSIQTCAVDLAALTFLVGQNGAGKSNFLDALRLVSESLTTTLEHALRERGGINEVRRRSSGHPTHFEISLHWQISERANGHYAFRVGAQKKGGFEVQREKCRVEDMGSSRVDHYGIEDGKIVAWGQDAVPPPASSDRLYLVAAAGFPAFRPIYDALSRMGFYNLNPDQIRELQSPDPGEVLKRDGSNLASVLDRMARENPEARRRVVEFLSHVVPGIQDVEVKQTGRKETLEFRQAMGKNDSPWRFPAENMSDGTLRALGILTALFQCVGARPSHIPLVGIEEPESAVHPGAADILRDGLTEAARHTQVIVTSHSPDLLDDDDIPDGAIVTVTNVNGETRFAPPDKAGLLAMRDRLYTAGELLRLNQLNPSTESIEEEAEDQLDLFAERR